jgi:hypothetical protein
MFLRACDSVSACSPVGAKDALAVRQRQAPMHASVDIADSHHIVHCDDARQRSRSHIPLQNQLCLAVTVERETTYIVALATALPPTTPSKQSSTSGSQRDDAGCADAPVCG